MATTKSTTSRTTKPRASRTTKPRASRPANDSLTARTGRTIKERPYTSAAIATGAVTAVAAVVAGAFFFSRRDKSFREASEQLTARVRDGLSSASGKVKDLAARGSTWAGSDAAKSQQEIAEEALTLKQTGATSSPVDHLGGVQSNAGVIAH